MVSQVTVLESLFVCLADLTTVLDRPTTLYTSMFFPMLAAALLHSSCRMPGAAARRSSAKQYCCFATDQQIYLYLQHHIRLGSSGHRIRVALQGSIAS